VIVKVANTGLKSLDFAVDNLSVTVDIEGPNAIQLNKTMTKGLLEPGKTFNITVGTASFTNAGYNNLVGSFTYALDGYSDNNTLNLDSVITYPDIATLPFIEDFESGINLTFHEEEVLDEGGWMYSQVMISPDGGTDGSFALQMEGGLPTGMFYDEITMDDDFWYGNPLFQASATICEVDPQGINSLMLSFDLKQIFDEDALDCVLGVFIDGVQMTDINGTKFFMPETQNDPFKNIKFHLFNKTEPFSVEFRTVLKASAKSSQAFHKGDNVYIDNVEIYEVPANDIRLLSVSGITSTAVFNDQKEVTVTFENVGGTTLTSIPLAYTINGAAKVSETWTGNLEPFASGTYTFTVPVTYDIEDFFDVHVYAELAGDADMENDTILKECRGVELLQLPYEEEFVDATTLYAHPTSQWERGIAQGNTITSTGNVWMTQLEAGYLADREDYLYTPYFDFSTVTEMEFELTHNFDFPLFEDGAIIEYTLDGELWELLPYRDSSLNWYNDYYYHIESDAWTRSSEGWIESNVDIDNLVAYDGPAQFRFRFATDLGVRTQNDGWAIANFGIVIPDPDYDMELVEISQPANTDVTVGEPITLEVTVRNNGSNAVDSIGVGYTIDGVEYIEGVKLANPIVQEQMVTLTIENEIVAAESDFELCAVVSVPKDEKPENDSKCLNMTVTKADYDAAIIEVVNPTNTSEVGKYIFPIVRIQNNGLQTLTAFDVYFNINNGISQTESWTGSLAPGATMDYTFSKEYMKVPQGLYSFCAIVDMAADQYTANDTLCVSLGTNGIDDMNTNEFALFQNMPNPTNGELSISFQVPASSEVNFEITNMLGQTVYVESIEATVGMNKVEMDVKAWDAGIYYYSVQFEGVRKTMKMMIAR